MTFWYNNNTLFKIYRIYEDEVISFVIIKRIQDQNYAKISNYYSIGQYTVGVIMNGPKLFQKANMPKIIKENT